MKTKVAMMFGGKSVEHEVSVISGIQAIMNMDTDKYEVIPVYLTKNNDMYVGEKIGDIESYKDIDALLKKCGLPVSDPAPMDELFTLSLRDKKHLSDGMNIVICPDIGESKVVKMSVDEYRDFLRS